MRGIALFTVLIAPMLIADASAARRTSNAEPISIVVRIYDGVRLPAAERDAAVAAADAIFEATSVRMNWRNCDGSAATRSAACDRPLALPEFALRLIAESTFADADVAAQGRGVRSSGNSSELALGYSLIDTRLHRGSLATIYPDRVALLAAASGVDRPTLLGRAIAHEMGHLLLGTNDHRATGIMRALWSSDALQHDSADAWLFTSRDAQDISAVARRRTAAAQATANIVWATQ